MAGFFILDMFYIYILYSQKANKYYVGQTDNIAEWISSHSKGISKYTSSFDDIEPGIKFGI